MSSAQIQEIAGAYNGYCWGGAHLTRKYVGDWSVEEDYLRGYRSWVAEWIVQVATDAAKTTEMTALRALAHPKCAFGVGRGRALQVTDAIVAGTALTSAAGGFTAGMKGLPIAIVGIGVSQIASVTNTNTLVLADAPGNGTALTAFVGNADVLVPTDFSTDQFSVMTEIRFPDDPDNTGLRWRVQLRLRWLIAADNARGCNAAYRQSGRIDVRLSESGHQVVTLSGLYTAGGGNDALANYSANIAAWVADALGSDGANVTYAEYAPDLSSQGWDDEQNGFAFRLTYRELPRPQGSSWDVATVRRVKLELARQATWAHGKGGSYGASLFRARWSSAVDSGTAYTAHVALYTGTVKPYIVAQALALLGGSQAVIVQESGPELDQGPEENRLSGVLLLLLRGAGVNDDLLSYAEHTTYAEQENRVYVKRHDGLPSTYNWWSIGADHTAMMTIAVESLGPRSPERWEPRRATPPFDDGETEVGSGTWHRLSRRWHETVEEIGRDRESVGSTVERWRYTWSAPFLFVDDSSIEAPSFEIGELRWCEPLRAR